MDEKALNFFKTFFNNRKHYVEWNGEKSEVNDLFDISICQGSTLGPPMYNMYSFNYKDVIGNSESNGEYDSHGDSNDDCKGIFFADDSLLILSGDNPEDLIKRGNIELEKTCLYINANKLLINGKKTQFLLYKPKGEY